VTERQGPPSPARSTCSRSGSADRGKYLIYFGAFRRHMSVFPGTVRFTVAEPLPRATVEEIVRGRLAAIDGV
jgi:hypothetical protein